MLNGRHFILLGILACAGLVSVHFGQKQVELCYDIALLEKQTRDLRAEIKLAELKQRALQSPQAVYEKAAELNLRVAPVQAESTTLPPRIHPEPPRSLGVTRRNAQ